MNVPKLRFKEFNGEWDYDFLKNISSKISYGMNSASKEYDGENKYIRITDIDENTNKYLYDDIVSPNGKLEDKYLLKNNDILFARTGASTGKTYLYNPKDGKIYFAGFLIKANIINHNSNFIFQQTKLNKFNKWIKIMSMRSGQPGISSQEYGNYKFSLTSIQEENKISNFLSLLDKKIELQSKKIETLKLYKKGLTDYLVNNMNIVNKKKLYQLGYTYNGLSGKNKDDFVGGNCKFITFMSVLKNNISEDLFSNVKICENEKQNKVQKGDLFFTGSSETKEEVGMVSTLNYDVDNLYLNSFCFGFRLNLLDEVDNNFLCNLLLSSKYRKIISNLGQGFTRVNISKKELLDIDIEYPNHNIQLRITTTLNNMHSKIKLEEIKLSKLNALKKGLMQNMFV